MKAPDHYTWRQLAAFNIAVIVSGYLIVLGFMLFYSEQQARTSLRELVDFEHQHIRDEYLHGGVDNVRFQIRDRMSWTRDYGGFRFYDYQGHGLRMSNLPSLPDTPDGQNFRIDNPIRPGSQLIGRWERLPDGSRLLVAMDESPIQGTRTNMLRTALAAALITCVISALAGFLLLRQTLHPLGVIAQTVHRIRRGDLSQRIPERTEGRSELDELARLLNSMLDDIEKLFVSTRQASDNIAHDLRTPLTRLRITLAQRLSVIDEASDEGRFLEDSLQEVDKALDVFAALLHISYVESGKLRREFTETDLASLTRDALDYMTPLMAERLQQASWLEAPLPMVNCHRHLIFQMLVNLLENAVKYGPSGGLIEIGWQAFAQEVVLTVKDQGEPIPDSVRERMFERLFRASETRQEPGHGLGLSLVNAIVTLHEGRITVDSDAAGNTFRITLPRA